MHYVIIGNSAAGISAAQEIRKLDKKCDILIISKEQEPVYSRCLLPDYISGELGKEELGIRDFDFYRRNKIKTLLGKTVTAILPQSACVILEDMSRIHYDKLLIATGSIPLIPEFMSIENITPYTLNSLEDAEKILRDSGRCKKVAIIGSGFIGIELAFALRKRKKDVVVIGRSNRILSGQLDDFAAGLMRNEIEKSGIELKLGCKISEIIAYSKLMRFFKAKEIKGVMLADGTMISCDMLVFASGTKANMDMVKGSGISTDKGIIVDEYMQTNIENIYAAGDVTETTDAVTKLKRLSPIWPNAVIQGKFAGYNMAGLKKRFVEQVSMQNTSEFREVPFISVGTINPPEGEGFETLVHYDEHQKVYRKIVLKDDIPVGMIFLGDIQNAGVVAGYIRNGKDASNVKHRLLSDRYSYAYQLVNQ
ncbi:NADH-dependent phenylglyoxylate dehydrogenase subunit epsilon [Oxobacter pfennigii]|uniref:NADH-dependent phenylglyoxylate dehydrogenase subunit epsilon n=1 Tax=Oxobacter pfennigii TaxID=36849 RepID=A0A0P8YGC9_9CLOT|nr:FAD-dependent oxidoreductase [Oxobacter pfennigii]KPU46086.1 NADH-dependent phenylglyoxylate dehydrogenase subunit epsilon [Oxobacter pfennigii]